MTETLTFARFGTVFTEEVIGECSETGSPLVELHGELTGVSKIEIETAKVLDTTLTRHDLMIVEELWLSDDLWMLGIRDEYYLTPDEFDARPLAAKLKSI